MYPEKNCIYNSQSLLVLHIGGQVTHCLSLGNSKIYYEAGLSLSFYLFEFYCKRLFSNIKFCLFLIVSKQKIVDFMERQTDVGRAAEDREKMKQKYKNRILSCPIELDKPKQRAIIWLSKTKDKEIR